MASAEVEDYLVTREYQKGRVARVGLKVEDELWQEIEVLRKGCAA